LTEILELTSDQKSFPEKEGTTKTLRNMTYKDGTMYSGEWMDGKRNGEGIQKYAKNS
jgi:hypothetical protein